MARLGQILCAMGRETQQWPVLPSKLANGSSSTHPLAHPETRFPPTSVGRHLRDAGPIMSGDLLGFDELSGSEDEQFGEPEALAPLYATMSPRARTGPGGSRVAGSIMPFDVQAAAPEQDAEMHDEGSPGIAGAVEAGVAGLSIADGFDQGMSLAALGADVAVGPPTTYSSSEDGDADEGAGVSDEEEEASGGPSQASSSRLPPGAFTHRPRLPSRSSRRFQRRKEKKAEKADRSKRHRR